MDDDQRGPCLAAGRLTRPATLAGVLEGFFTALLVLVGLAVGWFAILVVYKLFKGQS